ncbi:MAG: pseudouridine synthase [Armatimonadota bacterium]|nr:MAG: pseudouridine synthase [Armatimonadota bacterium]
MQERLQKVLAACGCGSRRECERFIVDGRVAVNGVVVTELGSRADPERDRITLDGRLVQPPPLRYIALYKPRGVASTRRDPHAKRTVMDLLPPDLQHLYPVGRLDVPSEGLVILTNDGDLANRLTHPRFGVPKVYRVTVSGIVTNAEVEMMRRGMDLEDGRTLPAGVVVDDRDLKEDRTRLEVVLTEGRKRIIRRMFEALGHETLRLKRMAIGPVTLRGLRPGEWRELTPEELAMLGRPKRGRSPAGPARFAGRARREPGSPQRQKKRKS